MSFFAKRTAVLAVAMVLGLAASLSASASEEAVRKNMEAFIGAPAVESVTKPFDIDCGGGVVIQLTGTLDRSRLVMGTTGASIADLKSGSTAVQKGVANTKGHFPQIGTYELLYAHTTGMQITGEAAIIGLKTKGTPEVAEAPIRGARLKMVGNGEHRGLIEFAADMFRTGLFAPNPQSLLCSPKYCARWGACPYHE